ncbi:MAG: hypothetical protein MHM6MM_000841 [Cercozoa sp. M6MM]
MVLWPDDSVWEGENAPPMFLRERVEAQPEKSSTFASLGEAIETGEWILRELDRLKNEKLSDTHGVSKFRSVVSTELKILNGPNGDCKTSNLSWCAYVMLELRRLKGEKIIALCHAVETDPVFDKTPRRKGQRQKKAKLSIDIVAGNGLDWIKVKAQRVSACQMACYGLSPTSQKSVFTTAKYLRHMAMHVPAFQMPRITMMFASGVSRDIARVLTRLGVTVRGETFDLPLPVPEDEWIEFFDFPDDAGVAISNPYDSDNDIDVNDNDDYLKSMSACSEDDESAILERARVRAEAAFARFLADKHDDQLCRREQAVRQFDLPTDIDWNNCVNIDVSTLLCLCSDLTHGVGVPEDFKDYPVIKQLAEDEQHNQALAQVRNFIDGKTLIVCDTARQRSDRIMRTLAGPSEAERAQAFWSDRNVVRVPDMPHHALMQLPRSTTVKEHNRLIFGTGETLGIPTVTSNAGLARAVSSVGGPFLRLNILLHPARPLTEKKFKGLP